VAMPIYIRNLSSGELLSYSLPILVGDVRPLQAVHVSAVLVHNKQGRDAAPISWPVIDGKFKVGDTQLTNYLS